MERSATRERVNHRRVRLGACLLILVGFVPCLLSADARAHGYMTYPKPRAVDHLKGDLKGWPIAGIKAKLRREPCIGLRHNKRFTEVRPGPLTLRFLYPDGANHTGFCYAYLFDPMKPGNRLRIGQMMDCARSDHAGVGKKGRDIIGHMRVSIPQKVPCDPSHCVLQWVWTATHISATNPQRYEHYDNCADLKVVGAQTLAVRTAAAAPVPAPSATWQPNIVIAQGDLQHMIARATKNGGIASDSEIRTLHRQIAELELASPPDAAARQRAQAFNRKGVELLRRGERVKALDAFRAAYREHPTDAEIVNNYGYAHLQNDNTEAAEPMLLMALVFEPGRANAWANLGETLARRGRVDEAVACFALAFRFSENRSRTRRFLQGLTRQENANIGAAARRALALKLLDAE